MLIKLNMMSKGENHENFKNHENETCKIGKQDLLRKWIRPGTAADYTRGHRANWMAGTLRDINRRAGIHTSIRCDFAIAMFTTSRCYKSTVSSSIV